MRKRRVFFPRVPAAALATLLTLTACGNFIKGAFSSPPSAEAAKSSAEAPEDFLCGFSDSVEFDKEKDILCFTVPKGLPSGYDFSLHVSGRLKTDGGMNFHLFEEESKNNGWEAGKTYRHEFEKDSVLEILIVPGIRTDGDAGNKYELEINITDRTPEDKAIAARIDGIKKSLVRGMFKSDVSAALGAEPHNVYPALADERTVSGCRYDLLKDVGYAFECASDEIDLESFFEGKLRLALIALFDGRDRLSGYSVYYLMPEGVYELRDGIDENVSCPVHDRMKQTRAGRTGVIVKTSDVIYTDPYTNGECAAVGERGRLVLILDENGDRYHVQFAATELPVLAGYIRQDAVSFNDADIRNAVSGLVKNVRVYESPGLNAKIKTENYSSAIMIDGEDGDFFKCFLPGGASGWIRKADVQYVVEKADWTVESPPSS